jgi:hypothetical protein
MDANKMKIVYVITERSGRKFWNRIGVAFVNTDGSMNVKLEAIPVSGEMQVRDYVPRDEGLTHAAPARASSNGGGYHATIS